MSDSPWACDSESLLAHAGWVRGLARDLTRTPEGAEDVEQQAWLGILGKPPADARNLRAWLRSVVRNTARQLGRGETRRIRRELGVAPAECAAPAGDLAERAELQREIASAVLALDEPYRTTILLRYWGAHSPAEIARLQSVPAGTVRSRLHRAHEELRTGLDRRVRGGRSAWSATLLDWGSAGEAKEVGLGAASSLLAGVAVMSWKPKLVLVVVAALAACWWGLREGPLAGEREASAPIVDTAASPVAPAGDVDDTGARGTLRESAVVAPVRTPVPVAPDPPALVSPRLGELTGQVRDAETGEPLVGAKVVWAREPAVTTDARGYFRIDDVPTGRSLRFYARAEGFAEDAVELELRAPGSSALDFELRRGSPMTVEVFDRESGLPVVGADVHGDPNVAPLARTDAGGRCEVRLLAGSELYIRVVAEGYYPFIWGHRVEGGGDALAPRIPLAPMGVIEGVVRDADGSPFAGVEVQVGWEARGFGALSLGREERETLGLPGHAGSDALHRWSERTDERGAFRIPVLPSDTPQRVVAKGRDGVAAWSEPVLVSSSRARVRVDVDFGGRATVSGRATANGEPREGAAVRWRHADSGESGAATCDAEGRFELTDVRPGAVTVFVVDARFGAFGPQPRAELVVAAGGSYEQDLAWAVEVATIAGRVTSTAGEPLAGIRVGASKDPLSPVQRAPSEATTAEDGTFAVQVLAAETYEVTVGRNFNERSRSDVAAGATDVDFVLPRLGVLPVQLVDAETGEPLGVRSPDVSLNWRESGSEAYRWSLAKFSHTGFAELHLPLGRVDLSIFANELGYAPALLRGVRVTSEVGRRPVELALTPGVEARLALTTEAGAEDVSFANYRLFLLAESQLPLLRAGSEPDGEIFNNKNVNGTRFWVGDPGLLKQMLELDGRGRATVSGLAPGRYHLRAYPASLIFEPESFEVGSSGVGGAATEPLEIRCRRRE